MSRSKSGKTGQRVLFVVGSVMALGGGALAVSASQHTPRVRPNTFIGSEPIGGLTQSQALDAVTKWFAQTAEKKLKLSSKYLEDQPSTTAKALGASLDPQETLKRVPFDGFWDEIGRTVSKEAQEKTEVVPVYSFGKKELEELGDFIEDHMKAGRLAKAFYRSGKVVLEEEIPGMKLDSPKLSDAVAQAMLTGESQEIPMVLAPKKVSDEDLAKIKEVAGRYATNFNNGQRERSTNIRLAAGIIDGTVLKPGETFSFNRLVGRRTAAGGFQRAGVFVNGRKDYDIGGGICQVSTTLYNAAVLSGIKIVTRSNHSRPVPYVPIGRDAAVSFPNPDLAIQNNTETPIAISSQVTNGRIEFRILGVKDPNRTIDIEQGKVSVSGNATQYVEDRSLGFGQTKVIESGASRRKIQTYRVVRENGKVVTREPLHFSYYTGAARIIARNSSASAPVKAPSDIGTESTPGSSAPSATPAATRKPAADNPMERRGGGPKPSESAQPGSTSPTTP